MKSDCIIVDNVQGLDEALPAANVLQCQINPKAGHCFALMPIAMADAEAVAGWTVRGGKAGGASWQWLKDGEIEEDHRRRVEKVQKTAARAAAAVARTVRTAAARAAAAARARAACAAAGRTGPK